MNIAEFNQLFYDSIAENEKYQVYLQKRVAPSKETLNKATASSIAGALVGKVVGIGWRSTAKSAIILSNYPIQVITMEDHKDGWKAKTSCYFSTFGIGTQKEDVPILRIKPEKKGLVNKQIIGIKFDRSPIINSEIEKDKKLIDALTEMFSKISFYDISDWTPTPINIKLVTKEDGAYGVIEACTSKDLGKVEMLLLFESISQIVQKIQSMLKKEHCIDTDIVTKGPEINDVPPPPPPRSQTLKPLVAFPTWGEYFEQLISSEGATSLEKKYSAELIAAQRKGLLNVIPQSLSGESFSVPQIVFIDRSREGQRITQYGSLNEPPVEIDNVDFFLKINPHLDEKDIRTPQAAQKIGGFTSKAPIRVIRTDFGLVSFTILEFVSKEYASSYLQGKETSSIDMAQKVVNFYPTIGFRLKLEEVLGFHPFEGMQILIRRLPTEEDLEFTFSWELMNFLFIIQGVNHDFVLNQENLATAMSQVQGNEYLEVPVNMLHTFLQNRNHINARAQTLDPPTNRESEKSAEPISSKDISQICPTCGGPLRFYQQSNGWYCNQEKKYVERPIFMRGTVRICPTCSEPLRYYQQNNGWYCQQEKKYV
jgi:hypothetical protein